ncbi:hypothetical protein M3B11_02750 [Brevibacterium sp. p3-SID960]|uniref:hypothetical protein n=1 Tax=Brevibacterium sp. p3-SID960 TaxID=2916063 RepID=UPI0021A7E340|nr:hypothetical protein [Brevibacterium sp. p3-SID960]MCT1689887.1 hypothetical protein [Brevibacterium sp. p3-SID960]
MTDRITAWLDESQRLADDATAGPWFISPFEHDPVWCDVVTGGVDEHDDDLPPLIEADGRKNAEFIAEARTRFPQAVAALREVVELHRPCHDAYGWTPCRECERPWPCLTRRLAEATLGLEGDDDEQ